MGVICFKRVIATLSVGLLALMVTACGMKSTVKADRELDSLDSNHNADASWLGSESKKKIFLTPRNRSEKTQVAVAQADITQPKVKMSSEMVGQINPVALEQPSSKHVSNEKPAGHLGNYQIGPGDTLRFFVWRNPELSVSVPVRPDGKVSIPLVEDLAVIGRTPGEVARDVETYLSNYIKNPNVTVIISNFGRGLSQQIRIIGAATQPKALRYQEGMTILDVIIESGGLTEFAAGNRTQLVREVDGKKVVTNIRLDDLLNKGILAENQELKPGDILIIPERWF